MKTKKIIGTLKHLYKYLPVKTLILMRPHLDYCNIIFPYSQSINGAFDGIAVNMSLNKNV